MRTIQLVSALTWVYPAIMLSHLWFMLHRPCITHGHRLFITNQRLRITAITAPVPITDTMMDHDSMVIIAAGAIMGMTAVVGRLF